MRQDAAWYAAQYGVSLTEALRRLQLQPAIGELKAALLSGERDVLSGFWVEHQPEYKIVIRLSQGGLEVVQPYVSGGPLAGMVDVQTGGISLPQLASERAKASRIVRELGIRFSSGTDTKNNRVQIFVTDKNKLESGLRSAGIELPQHIAVVEVAQLPAPQLSIYAGLAMNNPDGVCTSGFTVKQVSTGDTGVTTAGHCPNRGTTNEGEPMTFMGERWYGNGTGDGDHDVQWHKTPYHTDKPWTKDGLYDPYSPYYRVVTGVEYWVTQYVGESVCHYGIATEYGCGEIVDDTFDPDGAGSAGTFFVRVGNSNGTDLSEGGDSGGPWFQGGLAQGLHWGGWNNNACPTCPRDAIYMPIDYVVDWGLSVLTGP